MSFAESGKFYNNGAMVGAMQGGDLELLLFVHSGTIAEKIRPTEPPRSDYLGFLKAVSFFLNVMPLVDAGLINFIPDRLTFDYHLRPETMAMAEERAAKMDISPRGESRLDELMRIDFMRDMLMWLRPRRKLGCGRTSSSGCGRHYGSMVRVRTVETRRPLTALRDGIFDGGKEDGQMRLMQMGPNFEIAMYLAQATGASIVTDSAFRRRSTALGIALRTGEAGFWRPICAALLRWKLRWAL